MWLIVSLAGMLVGVGLLAVLFPAAFLGEGKVHFEITVSRPLVLGLVALLALLNTYLLTRRMEIRRVREELISRTIQQELVQRQSFTDPLTEIYNRHSLEDMTGRFISHARRSKKPLTLMMIDVDRFKDVNTRFGFELSLSIGVAEWSEGKTLAGLLDSADNEMYAAKTGQNKTAQSMTGQKLAKGKAAGV